MDEPLIYTTKGNLPVSSLRLVNKREDTPGNAVLVLEHFLGDEVVRRDVHVCPLVGICMEGAAASLA